MQRGRARWRGVGRERHQKPFYWLFRWFNVFQSIAHPPSAPGLALRNFHDFISLI